MPTNKFYRIEYSFHTPGKGIILGLQPIGGYFQTLEDAKCFVDSFPYNKNDIYRIIEVTEEVKYETLDVYSKI